MSHIPAPMLLLFAMLAIGAGCDRAGSSGEPTTAATSRQATTGATGATADGPQRIVSLAPSVTETLFALDAGDRLVAVTRFCDHPDEATRLPKVGGLTDVDVEMVLSFEPDLVVGVSSKTASGLHRTLDAANVETLFLPVETFDDVQSSIATLGARVDAEKRAAKIVQAIAATNVDPAAGPPVTVLVLFGRDPWIAAGPNTFADEMIRRAGGTNALADLDAPYPTLDAERLSALDPDLVFDTSMGEPDEALPIGGPDAVVRVDPALMRPGPRLSVAMKLFARAVEAQRALERNDGVE